MKNNKSITAVEWLVEEINKLNVSNEARLFINKLKEQAKEMEKQQIIDAVEGFPLQNRNLDGEQYYKETYGHR
jgi:hypothetical protein